MMSRAKSTNLDQQLFSKRFIEACGTSEAALIQRLLNISYQAAKNYLNGRLPDARVLLRIAERTPYSLHWLLTGEGDKFASAIVSDDTPILARQIGELIRQEVERALAREQATDAKPRIHVLSSEKILDEMPHKTGLSEAEIEEARIFRSNENV